jgi:GNAT superfamily N-acetyltransferase
MQTHKSETIERAAMMDLHDAADENDISDLDLMALTAGSSLISIARNLPASAIVVNRTLGTGLSARATREEVQTIVSSYAENDVAQYFVQLHPDASPTELPEWLRNAGLKPDRGWQKFSRDPVKVEDRPTNLSVREIGTEYGAAFGEIVCNAFDLGDKAIPWLAKLPGRKDWHIFMSFDGDQPAGAGALFIKNGFGWTDYGATSPEFRRRGSQAAVMAARLHRAIELGCQKIFTCTGVSVPGDPQHSYSNILKAGFKEEYIRQNYAPA